MPNVKLTKRAVEKHQPGERDIILWDTDLKGFACKITPKGRRVYSVYYRTHDGRQRRPAIGAHGAVTCEQAREIARQWLAEVAAGGDPSAERQSQKNAPTISDLADRYLAEHAEPHKRASSTAHDRRMINRHILPALRKRKVAEVARADVLKLHHSLREAPYEANRTLALISKMMNLAEAWGLRLDGTNPCRHVKRYAEKKRERFLTGAELARLGEALSEAERTQEVTASVIAAIRLLLMTGCRLNEILTLRWDDLDMEGQCLRLPETKTGAKVVQLSAPALEVLSKIERRDDNPYVIVGKKLGSHLVNAQKPWRHIRAHAGLDDVRLHDLRHTFASVAAGLGEGLPMIGKLLGHTQAATTHRYAHLASDPVKQSAERIGAAVAGMLKGDDGAKIVQLPKR